MKIVVLTDSFGKVQGAAVCNDDEQQILAYIENLLGAGLVDLRCQVVNADTLVNIGQFVSSEVKDAATDAEGALGVAQGKRLRRAPNGRTPRTKVSSSPPPKAFAGFAGLNRITDFPAHMAHMRRFLRGKVQP
jgi:hypothetical protein